MPSVGPINRDDLIRALRKAGFEGHMPAESISSWCAMNCASRSPIPMAEKSAARS